MRSLENKPKIKRSNNIWNKIKNTSAAVATASIMGLASLGCGSASFIEYDYQDTIVQDISMEKRDVIQPVVDVIDVIEKDTISKDVTIEENKRNTILFRMKIDGKDRELEAGEAIEINGEKYETRYNKEKNTIYLISDTEVYEVKVGEEIEIDGKKIGVSDVRIDRGNDSRVLLNIKVEEVANARLIIDEENSETHRYELMIGYTGADKLNCEFDVTIGEIDRWESSVEIVHFEANCGDVTTIRENFVMEQRGEEKIGTYEVTALSSVDLYTENNGVVSVKINGWDSQLRENLEKEFSGQKINVEKVFYDDGEVDSFVKISVNDVKYYVGIGDKIEGIPSINTIEIEDIYLE